MILRIFTRNGLFSDFIALRVVSSSIILGFCIFSFSSCQRAPEQRSYKEVEIRSPLARMTERGADPHAGLGLKMDIKDTSLVPGESAKRDLAWRAPQGWIEKKGSGFRLVTFTFEDIESSIVTLDGDAGGLIANIVRWMRQIGITVPPEESLKAFIASQAQVSTEGGFTATIVDLTKFQQQENDSVKSMMTGVIQTPEFVIFLKMTGPLKSIRNNRDAFVQLNKSVRLKK